MHSYIKKIFTTLLLSLLLIPNTVVLAQSYDFEITNNTDVRYTTGNEYVTVKTEYLREVKNKSYYYPSEGEKIFHIPDLPKSLEHELRLERQFKIDSLSVKDSNGNSVKYSVEELTLGEGIYVKVPNYKQTTTTSPYKIYVEYNTHDLVKKIYDWIVIQAPALPENIELEQTDSSTGTKTSFKYNLSIVTDSKIPGISKIYPSTYTKDVKGELTYYRFDSSSRINRAPYLEFGNEQVYKFELKYVTPKTDQIVPEEYTSLLKILSTNIYEISLPREFSETEQRVYISDIYPTPNKIVKDIEGNIIATFEVEANKDSEIYVEGYVFVKQDLLDSKRSIPNPSIEDYKKNILDSDYSKYLTSSNFWEVSDPYIQDEANKLADGKTFLMDIIKADYQYVNDKLEYDESKINNGNERIGAKAALQGGGSVCMEYADSMIALLRAQGIASRAALGYANLETLTNTKESNIRHQWVQVWIPDYGWLSIDPTYESNNMRIGQDIDRILWETFSGDELSNIRIYSADKLGVADGIDYTVKVYAVDKSTVPGELKNYSDIQPIQENPQPELMDTLNTFVKTTSLGKALVIVSPILILIVLLILVLMFISVLIKSIKARKASQDQQP